MDIEVGLPEIRGDQAAVEHHVVVGLVGSDRPVVEPTIETLRPHVPCIGARGWGRRRGRRRFLSDCAGREADQGDDDETGQGQVRACHGRVSLLRDILR